MLEIIMYILASITLFILSTLRHEASHALTARWYGGRITKFVFFPRYIAGQFYFGYVGYWFDKHPGTSVLFNISIAPYIIGAISIILGCFFWPTTLANPLQLFWFALLFITPIIDAVYNIAKGVFFGRGDLDFLCIR